MLDIVVYQCCQAKQRKLGEDCIRLAWVPRGSADFQDNVSMGASPDWKVAKVNTYTSRHAHEVERIHMVYLYRDVLPDISTWGFFYGKEDHPNQAFEIQISEIGSNFIGWAAKISGNVPEVGKYIRTYGIDPAGQHHVRVEPWFKTDLALFVPENPKSAFELIYLSSHIIKPVEREEATADTTEKATV